MVGEHLGLEKGFLLTDKNDVHIYLSRGARVYPSGLDTSGPCQSTCIWSLAPAPDELPVNMDPVKQQWWLT